MGGGTSSGHWVCAFVSSDASKSTDMGVTHLAFVVLEVKVAHLRWHQESPPLYLIAIYSWEGTTPSSCALL